MAFMEVPVMEAICASCALASVSAGRVRVRWARRVWTDCGSARQQVGQVTSAAVMMSDICLLLWFMLMKPFRGRLQ
jgi:hypothetical protein